MSDVKSVTKSVRQKNNAISRVYRTNWKPSEIGVESVRSSVDGNVQLEHELQDGGTHYKVRMKIQFLPEEDKVVLAKWYYKNSEQVTFDNIHRKPEAIVETEKAMFENFVMDVEDLELL